MAGTVEVMERDRRVAYSFEDVLKYHGPRSPGGAAIAFKALERALPLLDPDGPPERRELCIATAFGGPGARDAFELITRAVTDGRYRVDPALEMRDLGRVRERFVFRFTYRDEQATIALNEGFVNDEFIDLARTPERTEMQERRLDELKLELAAKVMRAPASAVFSLLKG
jgi:hypothetical protein